MKNNPKNELTSLQRDVVRHADLELAFRLWRQKDWETFKELSDLLDDLLAGGHCGNFDQKNYSFIFFSLFHLRANAPKNLTAHEVFLWDIPEDLVRNGRRMRITETHF